MAIPEEFIEELKSRLDVVQVVSSYVNLKRAGRLHKGLCPFHSEKTPSFTVYEDSQSFYCFGCGAGGDIVTFIRKIENLDYIDALKFLAARAGLDFPEQEQNDGALRRRATVLEINRQAARFFHETLYTPTGEQGLAYLRGRMLKESTIKHFGLGYAPDSWDALLKHLRQKGYKDDDIYAANLASRGKNGYYDRFRNRVMFPIIDVRGNVIAFGGRVMGDGTPKYLNSSDTPAFKKSRNLFALNFAKNAGQNKLILSEGYMDVIAMHQAGFTNAVATLGTAITDEQARLIKRYAADVIIAYDADKAGQAATQRAIKLLKDAGLGVRVLKIEGGKDPDEFIKTYGATRFKLLLEGSNNAVEYQLLKAREPFDLETADGKIGYLNEAVKVLLAIESPIEREVYMSKLAEQLEIDKSAIALQVEKTLKRIKHANQKKLQQDGTRRAFGFGDKINPQKRQNLKAAKAEESLIATLYRNPDFYKEIARSIAPDDFLTDFNRKVYAALCDRLKEGLPIDLIALGEHFTPDEMTAINRIVTAYPEGLLTLPAARDYIEVIREEKQRIAFEKKENITTDEAADYIARLRAEKNRRKL